MGRPKDPDSRRSKAARKRAKPDFDHRLWRIAALQPTRLDKQYFDTAYLVSRLCLALHPHLQVLGTVISANLTSFW